MPSDIWKDCWKMTEQADLFQPPILVLAQRHKNMLPDDFLAWLPRNLHVWDAFASEALTIHGMGRKSYSGRTIVEFLRHHTAIRQNPSAGDIYKINDHHAPYLCRLFELAYPQAIGFFQKRKSKKVYTDQ